MLGTVSTDLVFADGTKAYLCGTNRPGLPAVLLLSVHLLDPGRVRPRSVEDITELFSIHEKNAIEGQ
jgi:hypothetical protein